jgi:cystathionine beta-lyase
MIDDFSFLINQLGEDRTQYFGAVSPPIIASSNFHYRTVAEMAKAVSDEENIPLYTRGNNPTTDILNKKLAALEGTEAAMAVASGSAAVGMAVMSVVKAGDHVVCIQNPYSWTMRLFSEYLHRFGISVTYVSGEDATSYLEATKSNTTLYYLESPNSLTFELQDVASIASAAKEKGITTIIDNSYASPLGMQPAKMGIDLVVHAATKYLAGHSDCVAGAIMGSKAAISKIFYGELMTLGAVISPFNSWLMLRSLRTLEIRINRVSETTQKVVDFLAQHPGIAKIHYPHHPSHPQYELAKKDLKIPMGLFSIELATEDPEKITKFCESLRHFLMAVSWGGYESLIWPALAYYEIRKGGLPVNLIRVSIGLESADDLIDDLDQALKKLQQ